MGGVGRALVLAAGDSVAVAAEAIGPGPVEATGDGQGLRVRALEPIPAGHKLALRDIAAGAAVIKYGRPIGAATRDIPAGSWVHERELRSLLAAHSDYGSFAQPYEWAGRPRAGRPRAEALLARAQASFRGYPRGGGGVGTRNELWVIPTVGCVNGSARMIAELARSEFGMDAQSMEHPYGCSQLGEDLDRTRRVLASLAMHPNAAAAIVVSLGCESLTLASFKAELEARAQPSPVYLDLQDIGDEAAEARRILRGLASRMASHERKELPLSELTIGLKCGGSDGFSGISANPLVGLVCDLVVAAGGRAVMTELPEMFGAEAELLARASSPEAYEGLATALQSFKDHFASRGLPVYENPSPGNREGGITTLEEKSLGCIRKAGSAPVAAVIPYGGRAAARGLSIVSGPGNDLVSSTALAAAGAQVILFTTGRGTPLGSVVPTIKLSSTSSLAERKPGWIDFDAGRALSGSGLEELALELLAMVIATAGGERTKAELDGHRSIAIFKDGVTL